MATGGFGVAAVGPAGRGRRWRVWAVAQAGQPGGLGRVILAEAASCRLRSRARPSRGSVQVEPEGSRAELRFLQPFNCDYFACRHRLWQSPKDRELERSMPTRMLL